MSSALLLVDVQRNMLEYPNPVPSYKEIRTNLESLLSRARRSGAFVVHVQNDGAKGDPDEPNTNGWDLVFPPSQRELVLGKSQGDSFSNEKLASELSARGVKRLVIAGMQSDYCVKDTCKGAITRGYDVILASDAHATYNDEKYSANEISKKVELELENQGVKIIPAVNIEFT
jgi:streptothricin hydrolase